MPDTPSASLLPSDGPRRTSAREFKPVGALGLEYGQIVRIERPKVGLWKQDLVERPRKRARNRKRARRRGRPSQLPDVVELKLERPPVWMQLGDAELRQEVRRQLDVRELELIEGRRRSGREVLGAKGVLAQSWDGFPRRPEELFGTQPKVAGSFWARVQALQRIREFEQAHAEARARFVGGDREVVWPWGTWQMRVRYCVPCETSPP